MAIVTGIALNICSKHSRAVILKEFELVDAIGAYMDIGCASHSAHVVPAGIELVVDVALTRWVLDLATIDAEEHVVQSLRVPQSWHIKVVTESLHLRNVVAWCAAKILLYVDMFCEARSHLLHPQVYLGLYGAA